MAADSPSEFELKTTGRQGGIHVRAPQRSIGVSLGEAIRCWDVSTDGIYAAERRGQLHGLHIGNRVWYSMAELTALFGEPTTPPAPLNGVKNGESPKGGQLSFIEFEAAA